MIASICINLNLQKLKFHLDITLFSLYIMVTLNVNMCLDGITIFNEIVTLIDPIQMNLCQLILDEIDAVRPDVNFEKNNISSIEIKSESHIMWVLDFFLHTLVKKSYHKPKRRSESYSIIKTSLQLKSCTPTPFEQL